MPYRDAVGVSTCLASRRIPASLAVHVPIGNSPPSRHTSDLGAFLLLRPKLDAEAAFGQRPPRPD
jgi:hypothetical protein